MNTLELTVPNKLFKALCNQVCTRFAIRQSIPVMEKVEKYRDYIAYQNGLQKPLPVFALFLPKYPDDEFQWFFSKVAQVRSCPLSKIIDDDSLPKLDVVRKDTKSMYYIIDLYQ